MIPCDDVSERSEEDGRNDVFAIVAERRSLASATFIEMPKVPFGGRRHVPHDHAGGVHGHHEAGGVFQRHGLLGEDVIDLREGRKVIHLQYSGLFEDYVTGAL